MESEIAARSSTVEEECAATGAGATLPGRFERWTLGVRWKLSFGASDGPVSPRLGTPSSSHHRTATGEAYRYQ
jgi:hypothetical protein